MLSTCKCRKVKSPNMSVEVTVVTACTDSLNVR
jgi:hypothetical protein